MDARTARRIFEPFFSTKDETGTGLGLWVSLEILEKHQGISGSARGQGTAAGPSSASSFLSVTRLWSPSRATGAQGLSVERVQQSTVVSFQFCGFFVSR